MTFKERLSDNLSSSPTNICIGIDPHWGVLTSFLKDQLAHLGEGKFLQEFSFSHISVAKKNKIPAVKIQSAFFEAAGSDGLRAMKQVIKKANELDVLTILDAKRGDIDSTMKAYGQMAFDWLDVGAMTIVPYMGFCVVEALKDWLIKKGKAVYVVLFSSNPEGKEIQNVQLSAKEGSIKFGEHIFKLFVQEAKKSALQESLGFVFGATRFEEFSLSFIKEISDYMLLIPGLKTQGGNIPIECKKILEKKRTSLMPISRGVSGLDAKEELRRIKNWDDYAEFIDENLKKIVSE